MATKDWKKTRDEKGPYDTPYIVWENEETNDRISVWGLTDGKINPNKRATKSNIAVVYKVKDKRFKTKSRAMSFAKSYMRKN